MSVYCRIFVLVAVRLWIGKSQLGQKRCDGLVTSSAVDNGHCLSRNHHIFAETLHLASVSVKIPTSATLDVLTIPEI